MFEKIPLNDLLFSVLSNYPHGWSFLRIYKQSNEYIIDQPTITLSIKDEEPNHAIYDFMHRSGCDYCVDMRWIENKKVTLSLKDVPFDEAFGKLMQALSPSLPYQLVYRHSTYLVRTIDLEVPNKKMEVHVASSFMAKPRGEAILAVCDCLHRNFLFPLDSPIAGTTSAESLECSEDQLLDVILLRGGDRFLHFNDGNILMIFPEPLRRLYFPVNQRLTPPFWSVRPDLYPPFDADVPAHPWASARSHSPFYGFDLPLGPNLANADPKAPGEAAHRSGEHNDPRILWRHKDYWPPHTITHFRPAKPERASAHGSVC